MKRLKKIYKSLPLPLRSGIKNIYSIVPVRLRLGRRFWSDLARPNEMQWCSADQIRDYQETGLRKLIEHCYQNVPWCRRQMDQLTLKPADIRTLDDLIRFPVLTKAVIRENTDDLLARNFGPCDRIRITTSGTSSYPMVAYYDRRKDYFDYEAFIWRFFRLGRPFPGVSPGQS
jgi:phenylacetate-CoA ligase